ncbi:MAG: hypothetical protein ACO35C_06655 [Pontimonas sp.]
MFLDGVAGEMQVALDALQCDVDGWRKTIVELDQTIDDRIPALDDMAPGTDSYRDFRDDLKEMVARRRALYSKGWDAREQFLHDLGEIIIAMEKLYDTIDQRFLEEFEFPEEDTVCLDDHDL